MNSHLLIGEAARLLGTTPKTLRHYEKLGLITPGRSDSGYRVYAPEQILKLLRIRQLQALGLSLRQIKLILKEQDNEQLFETILQSLLDKVEEQIAVLEDRREQLEQILINGVSEIFAEPVDLPVISPLVEEYLDRHLTDISLWHQEKQLYMLLRQSPMQTALDYLGQGRSRAGYWYPVEDAVCSRRITPSAVWAGLASWEDR